MVDRQTLYESWALRRRKLDDPGRRIDPVCRKEQIRILDGLLKSFRGQYAANQPAQFPAPLGPTTVQRSPFQFRISRAANPIKDNIEVTAHARFVPVVSHIQQLNPQSACEIPKIAFFDIVMDCTVAPVQMKKQAALPAPEKLEEALPEPPPEGLVSRVLHADVAKSISGLGQSLLNGVLTFLETDPLQSLRNVAGLTARYASGMFGLLSRNDSRNAMDYVIDEIEPEHTDSIQTNPAAASTGVQGVKSDVSQAFYFDQRTIMLHEYASHIDGRQRDVSGLTRLVNRVAHTGANDRIMPLNAATQADPGLLARLKSTPPQDLGKLIEQFTERAIDFSGRAGESIASHMEQQQSLSDDVLKAFYFNLSCASRALHLIPLACAERAANGADELIRDQAAEFFSRSDCHFHALDRFRVELADGDPAVRSVAIQMLSQIGTLDDVGLLLDVSELPSRGQRLPRERRMLIRAAATLAGRIKSNEIPVESQNT